MNTDISWVPGECTLPTAEQPIRIQEFDELLQSSARSVERVSASCLRVQLSGDPDTAGKVASLAARESACCSFFTFTLTTAAGHATLDIAVPAQRTDILDALATRA